MLLARLDSVKLARQRLVPLMEQIGQTLALAVWGNHGPTIVHWEQSTGLAAKFPPTAAHSM